VIAYKCTEQNRTTSSLRDFPRHISTPAVNTKLE